MKKLRFRLQTILYVANTREMLALEEFAAVTQKVSTERTTLQNLLRELDYTRNIAYMGNLFELKMKASYSAVLQKQIELSRLRLIKLEKEMEIKRLELVEKMRDRQLLENLKGKAWIKYKKEAEREEQLFLDEIGVTHFSRKEGESL